MVCDEHLDASLPFGVGPLCVAPIAPDRIFQSSEFTAPPLLGCSLPTVAGCPGGSMSCPRRPVPCDMLCPEPAEGGDAVFGFDSMCVEIAADLTVTSCTLAPADGSDCPAGAAGSTISTCPQHPEPPPPEVEDPPAAVDPPEEDDEVDENSCGQRCDLFMDPATVDGFGSLCVEQVPYEPHCEEVCTPGAFRDANGDLDAGVSPYGSGTMCVSASNDGNTLHCSVKTEGVDCAEGATTCPQREDPFCDMNCAEPTDGGDDVFGTGQMCIAADASCTNLAGADCADGEFLCNQRPAPFQNGCYMPTDAGCRDDDAQMGTCEQEPPNCDEACDLFDDPTINPFGAGALCVADIIPERIFQTSEFDEPRETMCSLPSANGECPAGTNACLRREEPAEEGDAGAAADPRRVAAAREQLD